MKKHGCVYKRHNSKFWWIAYYHRGKQHHESCKSTDKRDADKLLLRREIESEQDNLPNVKAEKTKFDELAEDLLRDYRIHDKKSYRRAKECIKKLIDFFGGYKAHGISTTLIDNYIDNRMNDGLAKSSINRELAILKRAFNLGMQATPPKVLRKPFIRMLKENNVRKGFFEHDEFLALRSALPNHLKTLITLAYYTGMRKGEIVGLQWEQVDFSDGIIRLEQDDTKSEQPRTICMNDELFRLMVAHKRDKDLQFPNIPFVFYTPKGEPIGDFRKVWDTACEKVGLHGKLFHDFRRTAVRNMIRSGTPERVTMAISGHKTRSVFDRYNIVNAKDLRLAAQRIEAYTKARSEIENPFRELEELEKIPIRD